MKGFLAFVVCLVATNGYVPNYGQYEAEWLAWKSFHDKKYETQREDDARHDIWWDNFKASFKFIYWIRKINLIHEGFSATIVPLYCTFLSAVSSVHATKYSKTFSVQFKLWGPGSSSPWCNLYLHYVVNHTNPKSTQECVLWYCSSNATLSNGKASCSQETSHRLVANVREIIKDIRDSVHIHANVSELFEMSNIHNSRICGKSNRRSNRNCSCSRVYDLTLATSVQ